MRIKFIKLSLIQNEDNYIVNNDLSDSFNIGDELTVFGISINKDRVLYYIIWGIHIIPVPSDMFEIIDNKVSKYWNIRINKNKLITLWPELFYEEYFHDKFSEFDIDLRLKFKELKLLMLEEFNYPNEYEAIDDLRSYISFLDINKLIE